MCFNLSVIDLLLALCLNFSLLEILFFILPKYHCVMIFSFLQKFMCYKCKISVLLSILLGLSLFHKENKYSDNITLSLQMSKSIFLSPESCLMLHFSTIC